MVGLRHHRLQYFRSACGPVDMQTNIQSKGRRQKDKDNKLVVPVRCGRCKDGVITPFPGHYLCVTSVEHIIFVI